MTLKSEASQRQFAIRTVFIGAASYVVCRAFNQPNPFEKAALTVIMVGFRELAERYIQENRYTRKSKHKNLLIYSARLAVIPCALYAGWMLNFKAADYLQIAGLSYIGDNVYHTLNSLYNSYKASKLV